MLTYEAPLLGWPLTLARCIPGLLVPPLLGLLGQWLFNLLQALRTTGPPAKQFDPRPCFAQQMSITYTARAHAGP